jgi:hypothetical protein
VLGIIRLPSREVPQVIRKLLFGLVAGFSQERTQRLLIDTASEEIKHLVVLRMLYEGG